MIRLFTIPHKIRFYIHSRNNLTLPFKNNYLVIPYTADSYLLHNFCELYPMHNTILSVIIQSIYMHLLPLSNTTQYIDQLQYTLSFRKSHPNRQFHSIYWSAVLFTANLSLQSDYTQLFSKIDPPPYLLSSPYIPSISCNLIILIIHYPCKKYAVFEWFHTIYWSAV